MDFPPFPFLEGHNGRKDRIARSGVQARRPAVVQAGKRAAQCREAGGREEGPQLSSVLRFTSFAGNREGKKSSSLVSVLSEGRVPVSHVWNSVAFTAQF